ncbi:Glycosyltransferase family 4 protein [Candidatus Megaera venefica]|uniref:Glycosyltransferase family 4 protein n=1 Tax=Candidatus Megaera venefica TaxID=2055910 RepID=A0ABU5NAA0_9RICK|nr:glycosyltransferase family 4 protein [Candidatus Megaera venefica]MEA0970090.1 Glycosyltransferase family 4 protein [Candidatus Megaera venefica]
MGIEKKYHKKTILQVVPALISGGVERGTLEIAKKIVESGNISIVISAGGPLVEALEQDGSIHIKMNVASKNPITIWNNAGKIANIIRNYNVDIVHARSRAPAWSCYFAAKATGIKLITTFHGIYNFKNSIKKYYNSVMTQGVKVIAVSNFVKNHIIENYKIDKNKIQVIYRGVNHEEFTKEKVSDELLKKFREKYNVPAGARVLLLPSRMTRWKGHLILIEALEKIKHLNFYCIIAGDLAKHPGFVSEIQEKIQEYKIQNRAQLFGNEPNMMGLYGIADIVLSTSIEPEAFGRTIIEAQSMEKLVIATNIGGACETIQDGVTGFHVKAGDIDDLAKKIEYCLGIIGSAEEKKITSNARKAVATNFSLDLMLKSTLSIYNEID